MANLRERANKDLELSMEKTTEWGLPVVLISPDGVIYDTKKDSEDPLSGQVLHSYTEFNADTGEDVIIEDPVVILRRESLDRVPLNGEKWGVQIPEDPSLSAPMKLFILSPDKAIKANRALGIIKMYLQKTKQI